MTTSTDGLVEWLRWQGLWSTGSPAHMAIEAADRIEAQAARIAELEGIAKMVVEASDLAGFSGPLGDAARTALRGGTQP